MKIALDMDEVIASFYGGFLKFCEDKYGIVHKYEDTLKYELHNYIPDSRAKVEEFMSSEESVDLIKPIPGAIESIKLIHEKGHDQIIVTSRPQRIEDLTKQWLDQYLPFLADKVYFTTHFDNLGTKTKRDYCLQFERDLLIDDHIKYIRECIGVVRRLMLMDCPYNKDESLHETVTRVYNWNHILSELCLHEPSRP